MPLYRPITGSSVVDGTIAKADLDASVQASLDLADSALQVAPVTSVDGDTGAVDLSGTYAPIAQGFAPGNYTVAMGDSITSYNMGSYQELWNPGWWNHLQVRSLGRIRWRGVYASAGYTLEQVESTHLPTVLALSPAPAACFIFAGSNNCSANGGAGFSVTTPGATLQRIVAALRARGIRPILVLIPPNGTSAAIGRNVSLWNSYVSRYAQTYGYPVLDAFTPCVDPATGSYLSGYSSDNVHPTTTGHAAIAEYNLADLMRWFPPTALHQNLWSDTNELLTNGYGLFRVDTNADGVADGWSVGGTPNGWTPSLVSPQAADNLKGNWQQIERANTASQGGWLYRQITTGWSAGDVLQVSARIQTENLSDATGATKAFGFYARCTSPNTLWAMGNANWDRDISDGLVALTFTMPVAATNLYIYFNVGFPTSVTPIKYRMGQVTVRNLTTAGIATV